MNRKRVQEQVQTSKALDLLMQQELLAQFCCDEIAAVALEAFTTQSRAISKPVESGKVVEGLGGMMKTWRGEVLSEYSLSMYDIHGLIY